MGRLVVLAVVSFVNVPGPVTLVRGTINSFALEIPLTINVPLNPKFAVPEVLLVLFTFLIST